MLSSKLARIVLLGCLIIAGTLLLSRTALPSPEGVARERAMAAYAPAADAPPVARQGPTTGTVQPVLVNLKDIPAGVYDPNNQLARWNRGEIDLDENEGIISAAEMAARRAESLNLPASSNMQLATTRNGPSAAAPASGINFDSLDYTECCGGGGNVPPDPEMAAGPNHLIAVVNVAFEIYDKNGNSLVGPTTFASFMGADSNCTGVFDPNAIYDEEADRFILGIDADGSYYCAAVSQTGDPTGSWNIYSFPTGNFFFDYPHAGVGRDAIYMGANLFRCRGPFICSFRESRIWALDKVAMYNGQAANFVSQALPFSEDTPQPLNLHGFNQGTWPTGEPHTFFTNTDFNGATYSVWSWSDPFGANNVTHVGTIDLEVYTGVSAGMPINVPQANSSGTLQANDFRPQDFEYRNGYAWSVQTIACNPGGGTVDCIRWAQIDPANASVVDAGVYASNGQYRFFGDLAANHCDDMAVGYTKSSSSMHPAIWFTGRQNGDPAGTLQAEAELKEGDIVYTAFDGSPFRWGDYTGMTIDPDGVTFWYLGQYSKDTGTSDGRWGTYVGSFSYSCDVGGDPTPTPTSTPEVTPTPTSTPEDTPTPTATPEDTPTPTSTPEVTPTPTATPGSGVTMHVGDLDGNGLEIDRRTWMAFVHILVVDDNGNPVANANVSGTWASGRDTVADSCLTDSSGWCTVGLGNVRDDSATFTVNNVSHASLTYDSSENTDPDGDSNGTTITVSRP